MKLKASIAVATLAIGVSAAGYASAQSCTCPSAPSPVRQSTKAPVIVEEYYRHADHTPAPYYDAANAPPAPEAPMAADAGYYPPGYYPADYYAPVMSTYAYGAGYGGFYGGYPGFGFGYGRPVSGWYSHVGGGARWGGPRIDTRVAYTRGPGTVGRGVAVARGPGVPVGFAARGAGFSGGHAMVGGARMGGGGGGGGHIGGGGGRR